MKQLALDIGLSPGPTLAGYRAGPNRAALEHLLRWVGADRQSPRSPVPTYLWGETGCGKTHLLRATQAQLRSLGLEVGWLDASVAEPAAFNESWHAIVMDDVHAYGAVQQQAAFSWFVQAQTAACGVLAAGRLPPADLPLREDLRTRLGWGHVLSLQVLPESDRRAVLRQSADARGVFLSDEVLDYVLSRFPRDLGSLAGLLDRLDGYSLQTQRPITIPLIKSMFESN